MVLMDWGSAGWGVEVDDLAVVPLGAVLFMLEGYRELASLQEDPDIEARILWRHVQLGLVTMPRGPLPGLAWAERPLSTILDTLHFSQPTHQRRGVSSRLHREIAAAKPSRRMLPHGLAA